MSKRITASLSALTLIAAIAATFSGWIALSVVHPPPVVQVKVDMPVAALPIVIRGPAAGMSMPQAIAITRSSS